MDKEKLRPYQVAYLEVKRQKTEKSLSQAMKQLRIEDKEQERAQRLWDRWQLLTEDEKKLAGKLGLTPVRPKKPVRPEKPVRSDTTGRWHHIPGPLLGSLLSPSVSDEKPESVEEQRIRLKTELFHIPRNIYVWLDNMNYAPEKKGFYYVRYQNSMLSNGSTAYAHPVLVVQKSKLRPDQVEYMERKCRETIDDAKKNMKYER